MSRSMTSRAQGRRRFAPFRRRSRVEPNRGRAGRRLSRLLVLLLGPAFLSAQAPLSLPHAARLALESHPAVEAAQAGENESAEGVDVARAGRLPRLSYTESYLRSDNPVFAFGSLLNQRQFREPNFSVRRLNNPDPLDNFQSVVQVEQTLFDFNRTRHAMEAARARRGISGEELRASRADVLLGVVETYFGALLADESLRVAEESVRTAEADLRRAENMFEAGMATKADVLSVRVHRAALEEQRIRAANQREVAQAALNDALGLDLDRRHDLTTPLTPAPADLGALSHYEGLAGAKQPAVRKADLAVDLAEAERRKAKSALLPRLVAQAAFEADRGTFANQGGGNWLAGASLQWDVWKGSENRNKLSAARHAEARAAALKRQAASAASLAVRRAFYEFRAAQERLAVAQAAVAEAEESHRIIQNRYENGLENVTELIRSETALTAARFRRLAAIYDQRVARAALEHAAGNLTAASEVLR